MKKVLCVLCAGVLALAGCGSTENPPFTKPASKGFLGISWKIQSFKLITPIYDDCRNPGVMSAGGDMLFLFQGVKNAGAELDYDLVEPKLAPGEPAPFTIAEYEFEPGDFTALRLDDHGAKPGTVYCIEFKKKKSKPGSTRVRVYLVVKPEWDLERMMMFPGYDDELIGQPS